MGKEKKKMNEREEKNEEISCSVVRGCKTFSLAKHFAFHDA